MSAHPPVRPILGEKMPAFGITHRQRPARRFTLPRSAVLAVLLALGVAAGQLTAVAPANAASSAKSAAVIALAKSLAGTRYRAGGAGPGGFDCSGYTRYVYRKAGGRTLPHSADRQQRYGTAVPKSQARPGDLLVFRNGSHGFHAAVYAGGEWMYDAPQPGMRVGKHRIWSRNYVVRRIV